MQALFEKVQVFARVSPAHKLQIVQALSCRSERHRLWGPEKLPPNPYLHLALGGSFALQALVVPGLRNLLGIAPIRPLDGLVIGGSALLPLGINEMSKNVGKDGGKER